MTNPGKETGGMPGVTTLIGGATRAVMQSGAKPAGVDSQPGDWA